DAAELRLEARPAVAGVALLPGAGEGADSTRLRVDLADAVVPGVSQVDVPVGRHGEAVHAVEPRAERRSAIAAVALLTRARDRAEDAPGVHLADMLARQLDEEALAAHVEGNAQRL